MFLYINTPWTLTIFVAHFWTFSHHHISVTTTLSCSSLQMPEVKTSFHIKLGIILMQGKYRLCPHSRIMMIMHKRQEIWEKTSISERNSSE